MSLRSSLPLFAFSLFALAACSSSESNGNTTPADTGTAEDAGADTKKPADTGGETAVIPVCEEPLPADFACSKRETATGKTVCTEAALQDFIKNCLADDLTVPATCDAWKASFADCAKCVADWSWSEIKGQVYPDDYKCYWASMDATCADSVNCMYDCQGATCGTCDNEGDYNDCIDTVKGAGGQCADRATSGDACLKKFDISKCNVDEIYSPSPALATLQEQLLRFYRGACRDNANWAASESAGDAGTTDSGSTDSGAADSGAADTSVSDAAAGG